MSSAPFPAPLIPQRLRIVLAAGLLAGCATRPPALAPPPLLIGPLDARPLAAAWAATPADRDQDPRVELIAEVIAYYRWQGWQVIAVSPVPRADGRIQLQIEAEPRGDGLPAVAWNPPVRSAPMPAPAAPEGAHAAPEADPRLGPWLASEARILVDRQGRQLFFKPPQGPVERYAVAVGRSRTPTPTRRYVVEQIRRNPSWYPPASIRRDQARQGRVLPAAVPPGPGNPLGVYYVRLQDGIGIHGTNQPRSIGSAASYGCIRMHDRDVARLAAALKVGDGVWVVPDLQDLPTFASAAP
jgi:lipoprotein-anchoring transpeptidase ErfK/SrfK